MHWLTWTRALRAAVLLLLVVIVLLALETVENKPAVSSPTDIGPADVEQAKRLFRQNDPRKFPVGAQPTVLLSEHDANLILKYAASRFIPGSSQVIFRPSIAQVSFTIALPPKSAGLFMNIQATLRDTAGLPRVESVRLGRLPLPDSLSNYLLGCIAESLFANADHRIATDAIQQVRFAHQAAAVKYQWRADLPDRIRAALIPVEDQERLRAYQTKLTEVVARARGAGHVLLTELLQAMFQLAHERSAKNNPVAENRALLLTLALYTNGRRLDAVLPAATAWPRPARRVVTLRGRRDFPQHFTVSAALAAAAGEPVADAAGLYKEIDDARFGSGFSFQDIAVDRAGSRFGELAEQPGSARRLQQQMRAGPRESDLAPPTDDLPEYMSEAEFNSRFGGVGAPAYQAMTAEIDKRIAALPLYR